jgi:high-affinity nickel permease
MNKYKLSLAILFIVIGVLQISEPYCIEGTLFSSIQCFLGDTFGYYTMGIFYLLIAIILFIYLIKAKKNK